MTQAVPSANPSDSLLVPRPLRTLGGPVALWPAPTRPTRHVLAGEMVEVPVVIEASLDPGDIDIQEVDEDPWRGWPPSGMARSSDTSGPSTTTT